jgi:RimJ/RimL family protein N-acetyltransferase
MKGFYYISKGMDIMRACQINLKQEVTRNDAMTILKWMRSDEVTKYLNESDNVDYEMEQAIKKTNMPIMTHVFNRDGSFYLIHTEENNPIGFIKLLKKQRETEMVIVIGDKNNWGQGLGKASIKKALDIAFFQWRVPRVVAKIHPNNIRSIKAFEKLGFLLENEYANMKVLSLTMDTFIKNLKYMQPIAVE